MILVVIYLRGGSLLLQFLIFHLIINGSLIERFSIFTFVKDQPGALHTAVDNFWIKNEENKKANTVSTMSREDQISTKHENY